MIIVYFDICADVFKKVDKIEHVWFDRCLVHVIFVSMRVSEKCEVGKNGLGSRNTELLQDDLFFWKSGFLVDLCILFVGE